MIINKYQRAALALASFKPRIRLVNYVKTTFTAHDSIIAVALAQ
jgi:hypothetical protein